MVSNREDCKYLVNGWQCQVHNTCCTRLPPACPHFAMHETPKPKGPPNQVVKGDIRAWLAVAAIVAAALVGLARACI